jgi:hypothetical protein
VQIVNGYLCMNCCDVDKAREGKDPHQSNDQIQKQLDQRLHPLAARNFGPDTLFGGSLAQSGGGNAANGKSGDGPNAASSQTGSTPLSQAANGAAPGFNVVV